MWVGSDFSPADPLESEIFAFDFRKDLSSDEVVVSALFSLTIIDGTDSSAATRLVGPATVSGTLARQRVAGLLAGNTYRLEALVVTNQGNTKTLWARVACRG